MKNINRGFFFNPALLKLALEGSSVLDHNVEGVRFSIGMLVAILKKAHLST